MSNQQGSEHGVQHTSLVKFKGKHAYRLLHAARQGVCLMPLARISPFEDAAACSWPQLCMQEKQHESALMQFDMHTSEPASITAHRRR